MKVIHDCANSVHPGVHCSRRGAVVSLVTSHRTSEAFEAWNRTLAAVAMVYMGTADNPVLARLQSPIFYEEHLFWVGIINQLTLSSFEIYLRYKWLKLRELTSFLGISNANFWFIIIIWKYRLFINCFILPSILTYANIWTWTC